MRTPVQGHGAAPAARGFSFMIDVGSVPDKGMALTIEPPISDLPAIAEECGLPALADLRVRCKVLPRAGGRFEVTGAVGARVTQVCVITLEPFVSTLSEDFEVTFAPTNAAVQDWLVSDARQQRRDTRGVRSGAGRGRSERASPPPVASVPMASVPMNDDTPDTPDPIINGEIDVGAVALEFLVLALDPYPKKPGVAFADIVAEDDDVETSAFAALARLKDTP